jgi:hypothetical protein
MLAFVDPIFRSVVIARARDRVGRRDEPALCKRAAKLDSQAVVLDARCELPMRVRGGNARGKGFVRCSGCSWTQ